MSVDAMSPFQKKLKYNMSMYVHVVYRLTKLFPADERFSTVSQLKRAAMSVVLNYIEGFTRRRVKVQLNFFEISYGSLHESIYIIEFAKEEKWISEEQHTYCFKMADEIGAMLWSEINSTEQKIKSALVLRCLSV